MSRGHDDLERMLGITHEQVHDLKGTFRFTVKEVKRLEPHEVNASLFDKVYGEGVVTDEKAFREKVAEDLDGHFDRDAEWVFRRRFVVDLIEKMKVELPDAFLKRWIMLTNEKPLTPEQVEEEYPRERHIFKITYLPWQPQRVVCQIWPPRLIPCQRRQLLSHNIRIISCHHEVLQLFHAGHVICRLIITSRLRTLSYPMVLNMVMN